MINYVLPGLNIQIYLETWKIPKPTSKLININLIIYLVTSQHGRRRIITFEFGSHLDTYFCNLEGHGSLNPLKLELKNSGFWRNCYTGCPKKASVIDFSDFLD